MGDQPYDKIYETWDEEDDGCYFQSGQGSPPSGFVPSLSLVPEREEIDWISGGCESQPDDMMWIDNPIPSLISGKLF